MFCMRAFAKAVTLGTLAGAFVPMMFTIVAFLAAMTNQVRGQFDLWSSLLFVVFPIPFTLVFVLPASLFVGLPLTALLSRLKLESSAIDVGFGILVGLGIPMSILLAYGTDTWWFALLGAFSGAVTGRTWWVEARESRLTRLAEF
ncbi:MAG: hypothetical protein C0409_01495 [Novosphingobium sp.]|nr:hypothetical protein [Novosphingobium sp.]